ncbi:MAG: metallophosphoesterase family protein [Pseudomonadota bacterium]
MAELDSPFSLPTGQRVYAIGDIHGMSTALRRILDLIDRHLEENPPAGPVTEVFLGDYVDRGPDSFGVIEQLLRPPRGRNRVCLLGNHEDAMIAASQSPSQMERWLRFGAPATLRSYGIDGGKLRWDPHALQSSFAEAIPQRHQAFFRGLERTIRLGDLFFVHAGIRPQIALAQQDPDDLIWIRHEFLDFPGALPVHVVHGHTPVVQVERQAYRTNVDTGAVFGGALTAAVLEGSAAKFLSVPTA